MCLNCTVLVLKLYFAVVVFWSTGCQLTAYTCVLYNLINLLTHTQIINHSCFSDVSDLQNFVNISLATAAGGEGDLARDKLSNLRTVGSGFGALIYKLPPDAGYETFVDRCKLLWETLRSTPKLPDIMVHSVQYAIVSSLQQILF